MVSKCWKKQKELIARLNELGADGWILISGIEYLQYATFMRIHTIDASWIDTIAVENEFAETWLDRRELDYLIYNDPLGYADLVLNDDVKKILICIGSNP